ncbi:MAG TPA: LysR family transcriptional regulator [Bacillota bacterium]
MDEVQLRTFLTAARYGSFSDAARALFVAQSSVTHRVRGLEREIGARLFHRQGRGVSLTEAGRAFIPYAQRSLAALEQGRKALTGGGPPQGRRLRVLACPLASACDLPGVLTALPQADTPLEIQVTTSKRIFKRLLRGDADLGLTSIQFRHPEMETIRLGEHPLVAVGPGAAASLHFRRFPGPARAAGRRRRSPAGGGRVLFHQEELEDLLLAQDVCRRLGWPVDRLLAVGDLLLLRTLTLAGFGWGLVPRALVSEDLATGRLEVVDVAAAAAVDSAGGAAGAVAHRTISLLVPRRALGGPAGDLLHGLLDVVRG